MQLPRSTVHHSASREQIQISRTWGACARDEPSGGAKVAGLGNLGRQCVGRTAKSFGCKWLRIDARARCPRDSRRDAGAINATCARCGGGRCYRREGRDRARWGQLRKKSGRKPELRVRAETRSRDDRVIPSVRCASALSRSLPEDRCRERQQRDA